MPQWWRWEKRASIRSPLDVYDGDTLWITLDMGMRIEHRYKARLDAINTPELNAADPTLRAVAFKARDRVRELVVPGAFFTVETHPYPGDAYGRWLTRVILPDGELLADVLLREGLAMPYGQMAKP